MKVNFLIIYYNNLFCDKNISEIGFRCKYNIKCNVMATIKEPTNRVI